MTAKLRHRREPLSRKLRFETFKRDGFECQYCGRTPPTVLLECDHIEPVSGGGRSEMDNLITACFDCNRGKGAVPLDAIPQSLSERAAEVLERERQIAGYQDVMKQRRMRIEADAEQVFDLFCTHFSMERAPWDDFRSIKFFIEKIGLDACLNAAELSFKMWSYRKAFRYFCGVCWNLIRGPRE